MLYANQQLVPPRPYTLRRNDLNRFLEAAKSFNVQNSLSPPDKIAEHYAALIKSDAEGMLNGVTLLFYLGGKINSRLSVTLWRILDNNSRYGVEFVPAAAPEAYRVLPNSMVNLIEITEAEKLGRSIKNGNHSPK